MFIEFLVAPIMFATPVLVNTKASNLKIFGANAVCKYLYIHSKSSSSGSYSFEIDDLLNDDESCSTSMSNNDPVSLTQF